MLPTVTRYQALSRGHAATFNDQQKSAHDNSLPPQLLPEKHRSGWATSVRAMSLTWTSLTVVPPTSKNELSTTVLSGPQGAAPAVLGCLDTSLPQG